MKPEEFYTVFTDKLKKLRKTELLKSTMFSSVTFLLCLICIGIILLIIESFLRFSSSGRYILIYTSGGILLILFLIIFFEPLRGIAGFDKNLSFRNLCLKVGKKYPEIRDKLINALQVYENRQHNKEGYSSELIDRTIVNAGESYINLDFNKAVNYEPLGKRVKVFVYSIAGIILLSGIFAAPFRESFIRIINPGKEFPVPLPFSLTVKPGNKEIVKGDRIIIEAEINGKSPDNIWLRLNYDNDEKIASKQMNSGGNGKYVYELNNVRESFTYSVAADKKENLLRKAEVTSKNFRIDVLNPPLVKKIKIRLDYPSYSKLGSRYLDDNIGDITALKGTKALLEITSNKPLQTAAIQFSDSTSIPMEIYDVRARTDFVVKEDKKYHIAVSDEKGITNQKPIDYWLTALRDEYPFVQIVEPGRDIDIDERMKVPLCIRINDDYGFSDLKLNYFRVDKQADSLDISSIDYESEDIEFGDKSPDLREIDYEWNLAGLNLLPEDVVMYFIEVFDNDVITGPKLARSSLYTVRFPSIFEIFSEVENKQNEKISELEDIVQEGREVKEQLEEIILDLKRSSTIDWENKKGLEESIKRTEEIRKKLEQVRKDIEEITSALEKNNLFSPETMSKYAELQKLFQEIMTPELEQALENLKNALNNMGTNKTKQAMDKFKLTQQDFLKRIERTTNILKQIQIEQKMDEVIKKSETLLELQNEINKTIDELKEADEPVEKTLSSREEKLADNSSDLKYSLEDLLSKMSESLDMPYKEVGDIIDEMERMKLNERMLNMSELLKQGARENAHKSGQMISGDLTEINDMVKKVKENMLSGQKSQIMSVMKKSIYDMIELSKRQEMLKNNAGQLHQNSTQFEDVAERQNEVLSGLSKITEELVELSQKTFYVTPEIGKAIAGALRSMGISLRLLEERNGQGAAQNQGAALSYLNEAAVELRNSFESLSFSDSPSGLDEYLKRLEQMAGMQQGINKQTSELPLGKGYTEDQMQMMRQLAEEQEALRRGLEELYKEMGNRSQVPGRLDDVGKTMEEVVKDLKNLKINERTLRLQERILSRLLDAQRSVRTKDYSKKRESEVGKEYDAISPGEIPVEILYKTEVLREYMLKALEEGYTKDYLELIRKYFEALNKEIE